ncbi:uncharacterized protein LOC121421357 [Lytechinus variegatus]|uniref:uncharacterized protein LOC121421357 n=1 Tax=Lytechinus variegatus TaxID=7654 RepID=UPI001BB1A390|nr:uncharacterized protein LOC121421357 [Lytechinus variegatus]
MEPRFVLMSNEELDQLLDNKDSKSTKNVVKQAIDIFSCYCRAKSLDVGKVETEYSEQELCECIRSFYAEVRRGNGQCYAKSSMITIRYGLQKHFLKTKAMGIVNSVEFRRANDMFAAVLHKLKAEGKGSITHKDPISKEDFKKIMTSRALDRSTPRGLQNAVFVNLMLHLCNRGRENLKDLRTEDFAIATDSSNRRYGYLAKDKLTKNHRGDKDDDSKSQCGRMYETKDENCPVKSFCEYVSHLNCDFPFFWHRPKSISPQENVTLGSGPGPGTVEQDQNVPWYDHQVVGKNALGNKMKSISIEANTSRPYTNHCIRATTITTLDEQGFEARHIMTVSGHKSESSLKHYSRVDEGHKRQMSLCLSEKCQSKVRLSTSPSSTTRSNGARSGPGPGSGPAKERSGPPCTVSRPPRSPVSSHPPPESAPDVMTQPQDLQRSTLGPGPSPGTTSERSASGKPCGTISRPPSSPVIS